MAEEFQLGPASIRNAQALAHLLVGIGRENPENIERIFAVYSHQLHLSLVRLGSGEVFASQLMSFVSSAIEAAVSEVLAETPERAEPSRPPDELTIKSHAHTLARHLYWGCRRQSEVGVTMRVRAYFREVIRELVNLGEDPGVAINLILAMAQVRLRQLEKVMGSQIQE